VSRGSKVSYHERKVNRGGIRLEKVRVLKRSTKISRRTLRREQMVSNFHCDLFTRLHLSSSTQVLDSSSTLQCEGRFLTNPCLLIAHDNPHILSEANLPSRLRLRSSTFFQKLEALSYFRLFSASIM
jgi:hypothetical protein